MARVHFTSYPNASMVSPCSNSNMITKEYYDFLVGEINRGVIKKTVCEVYYPEFNYTSYHLLTD